MQYLALDGQSKRAVYGNFLHARPIIERIQGDLKASERVSERASVRVRLHSRPNTTAREPRALICMHICLKVSPLDICRASALARGAMRYGEFNIENIRSIHRGSAPPDSQ